LLTGSLGRSRRLPDSARLRIRLGAARGPGPPREGERKQMAAIIQGAALCAPPAKPIPAGERREPA
jgi:hypothetical protein